MTQNNPKLESAENQKVVVLDDDRLSSHNLSIQLKFVGETPVLSNSDNWKQLFQTLSERHEFENVIAIALGVIKSYSLLDLLNALHSHFPKLPLVLLNNQEEIQYSLLPESLQAKVLPLGDKALNYRSLLVALQNARELNGHPHRHPVSSIISETGTAMFRSLIGQSEVMQKVRQLLQGVASRDVTALVLGEAGTGKEIAARNLHYLSGRSEKPFIVVSCAGVSPDRQGVELFGHEKNFQGASTAEPGLIEKAQGGTLFFDEISELPLNVQGMLLRFLEEKKYQRVGAHATVSSDVRVVAASRYNLEDRIRQGNFRQDLYYRLNIVPIDLPPLRHRAEDIPDLVKELLSRLENKEHSSIRFNSAAIQSLQQHFWTGNVRELANLVERMCIIKPNEVIGVNDLPQEYQYASNGRRMHSDELLFQGGKLADQPAPVAPQHSSVQVEPGSAASNQGQVPSTSGDGRTEQRSDVPTVKEQVESQPVSSQARESSGAPAAAAPVPAKNKDQSPGNNAGLSSKQMEENLAMMPLNAERLQQYLTNLEKNLLEVAMLDSANIMKFAADRLKLDESALREKLQKHGMA
jgi:sigma-54 dependent transcriptional regulator, flagellar regulatory protein